MCIRDSYKTMYPTGFVLEKQLLDMLKEKYKDFSKETEEAKKAEEELKLDQLLLKRTFKLFDLSRKGWGKQLIGFREVNKSGIFKTLSDMLYVLRMLQLAILN